MEESREFHARRAAELERQYDAEAREYEAERRGRFQSAKSHFKIAGVCAILSVVSLAVGGPTVFPAVATLAFGLSAAKKLIRAL